MTILDKVKENAKHLQTLSYKELVAWGQNNGMNSRSGFSRFTKALPMIDVYYQALKTKHYDAIQAAIPDATHAIDLTSDAASTFNRFAIVDYNGTPAWYGLFFDNDIIYNGEQSTGEMAAACKAVWLAKTIAGKANVGRIRLNLKVDAQWLCYANGNGKQGGKALVLRDEARKNNVELNVIHISGKSNPADEYTRCRGYQKWQERHDELAALVYEL